MFTPSAAQQQDGEFFLHAYRRTISGFDLDGIVWNDCVECHILKFLIDNLQLIIDNYDYLLSL